MRVVILLTVLCVAVYAHFKASTKKAIVDYHNQMRSKIAKGQFVAKGNKRPPAADMLKMKWDNELANSAQKYADKCPSGHSWAHATGENMFGYWTDGKLKPLDEYALSACGSWFGEFEKYGWKTNYFNGTLFDTGVGHATQIAWAKTGKIGCGAKDCTKKGDKGGAMLLVCQYKEQGNIMTRFVYEEGKTCSKCPKGTTCEKSTGLCQ